MKTILVPVDFSIASKNALQYAVSLAKDIQANVILLNVFHIPLPTTDVPLALTVQPEELKQESENLLKKEIEEISTNNIKIDFISMAGLGADEILEFINLEKPDMVIMGMKGSGNLTAELLGSTVTDVVRKSTKPVFVIPEEAKYKKPARIALAIDYDPRTNMKPFETIKQLSKALSSKIFIVNICKEEEPVSSERGIPGIKIENTLGDVEHLYYFPEENDVVEGLNKFAEKKQIDLIGMIPHRHNLLERFFGKSVSKRMAFHTRTPLIMLPDNHKTVPAYFL